MEEIITPSQAAALLQLNVRTVYRLAQQGVIPGNKIGRGWRFSKEHILDLVTNQQREERKESSGGKAAGHKEQRPHS